MLHRARTQPEPSPTSARPQPDLSTNPARTQPEPVVRAPNSARSLPELVPREPLIFILKYIKYIKNINIKYIKN